jgi:two-component system CheB/CheR fusion protein
VEGVSDSGHPVFRNPRAVTALAEKIVPALLQERSADDPVRIWVPGCSTGEEAYTIALLVQEQMDKMGRIHSVQIFATDIDEGALQIARSGIYPASIAADVPAKYLRRYFLEHPQGFQISKTLRGALVFALHDITRDPPFSRMDLVSCRNLLIYMRPQLQTQVLDILSYALKPAGVLFLGHSESLGSLADLYETVDNRSKLYRRRGTATPIVRPMSRPFRRTPLDVIATPAVTGPQGIGIQELTETALLEDYTPACVVIDDRNQLLYIHGHTGLFLEPAIGRASMDVLKMAREGLRNELSGAIRTAKRNHQTRRFERLRIKV